MTKPFSTGDLLDDNPDLRCTRVQFRSFGGIHAFAGAVRTVSCREENSRLRELVDTAGSGDVLVVDGGASLEVALLGDRLAQRAADNGWSGFIIDGAVRDSAALADVPIGVMARGVTPRRSPKRDSGHIDVVISVGGTVFAPGDFVWADADGVVVASADEVQNVAGFPNQS